MYSEILHWVKSCNPCQECKVPKTPMAGYLKPMVFGRPFQHLSVDVTGPFPETKNGNRYIVVFIDHFTKWPEAFAIKRHTKEILAKLLIEEVIARYGVPKEILADRGGISE